MRINEVVQLRKSSGTPVRVGDVTVSPQSLALIVRWPSGGLVWNRPVAVAVEQGGLQERLPVIDVTRLVQVGLFILSLAFAIVGWAASGRQTRSRERSQDHE